MIKTIFTCLLEKETVCNVCYNKPYLRYEKGDINIIIFSFTVFFDFNIFANIVQSFEDVHVQAKI